MKLIGDLILLPELKTVIHLKDAFGPEANALKSELVFTKEVARAFQAIYHSLKEERGKGFFIEGGYGSGKSHFLAALYLYLSHAQTPPLLDIPKIKGQFLVIPISLIDYGSEIRLQEIVLEAINSELQRQFQTSFVPSEFFEELKKIIPQEELTALGKHLGVPSQELFQLQYWPYLHEILETLPLSFRPVIERRSLFDHLKNVIFEKGLRGVVILIDELSEFLKSKSASGGFQEDIRFLQFLGEMSQEIPLWIIATLQERIETTGDIPQDAFAKIKDRYPVRLIFAGSHIEEIVSERLVKKRPGARGYLRELYDNFKQTFKQLPFDWETWYRLYPIHPLTIQLLDELRGLFSQARGAVDFVYSRLKGDSKRNIPPLLNAPAQTLLSPTAIFDHFLDRIRETLETNPYYEKVYCFYEKLIPKLFPDPETRQVALELIKLLILMAISPIVHRPNTRELALAILYPFTDLDPALNFRFVHDILSSLVQEGAYLHREPQEDFLKDRFYLDLEEDTQFIVKKRYEQIASEIKSKDSRIYHFLYTSAHKGLIPFSELHFNQKQKLKVLWQNTYRLGEIHFISVNQLEDTLSQIDLKASDFYLLILKHPLKDDFSPPSIPPGVAIWEPAEVQEDFLKKAYVYAQLLERYQDDQTQRGQRFAKFIKELFEESLHQAVQELTWSYLQGALHLSQNETFQVTALSQKSWLSFVEGIAALILEKRHPKHHLIAPHLLPPPLSRRQLIVEKLIIPGEIYLKRGEGTLKTLIDGLLRPLGILKKVSGGYRLWLEAKRSPILEKILDLFANSVSVSQNELYEILHSSDFGLCKEQYELLLLALIHTGKLVPYHQNKRVSPFRVNLGNLHQITHLKQIEQLDTQEMTLLKNLPFLPPSLQGKELTVTHQEALWHSLKEFKEMYYPKAIALETFLKTHIAHPLFTEGIPLAQETIQTIKKLCEAVRSSYAPTLGLKHFCEALKQISFIDFVYARFKALVEFYSLKERILFIYDYLHHPDLQIPSEHKEVKELFQAAKAALLKANILFETQSLPLIEEKFNAFFNAYTHAYKEAHDRLLAGERFGPYLSLRQTDAYKLIRLWASIPVLPARTYLDSVEREINQTLRQICEEDVSLHLAKSPVCICGWHLGERPFLPPLARLQAQLEEGIDACLNALCLPPLRPRLEQYIVSLREIGKEKEAQEMVQIFNKSLDFETLLKLTPYIKKALTQGLKIVERNLDLLVTRLKRQSLTKDQIERIFKDWLEGKEGVSSETYIKITSSYSGIPPALELAVREYDPSFIPLMKKWKENFFLLLVFISWCHLHHLPITLAAELAKVPEREWTERQASLLKLGLRCLHEEAFKEWIEHLDLDEDYLWQYLNQYQSDLSQALIEERIFPSIKLRILSKLLEKKAPIPIEALDEDLRTILKAYQGLEHLINKSFDFDTIQDWERFYIRELSRMEINIGILVESSLPSKAYQKLIKRLLAWRKGLEQSFNSFYKTKKRLSVPLPSKGTAILFDGLRWDLWEDIKSIFLKLGYKPQKEGAYWAQSPTDTFTQLYTLGLDTYFENIAPNLHIIKKGNLRIFKIDVIDSYIHKTHLYPLSLKQEVIPIIEKTVISITKGTKKIFTFSDHGFKMDLRNAIMPSYKRPLYKHGEVSPEEVIVPWAFWAR